MALAGISQLFTLGDLEDWCDQRRVCEQVDVVVEQGQLWIEGDEPDE